MAVTLAQAAVLSQNDLQRGVLETYVQESPLLDRLPLMDIEGNAYAYNEEATLPGVAFRSVNEAYVESTGTVVQRTETLSILGGDADVDRFIVKTRGNLNDQRATQLAMKIKASSYKFQDTFINGDITVDPKGFDGLRKRLVGNQVIDAATNGMGVVSGGHDFFDVLDAAIARVPGINGQNGAIYANSGIVARVLSSGRRLGGAELVKEDLTGKRVAVYNGIPVLDIGLTAAGANIIPQTETQGSSSAASSIYVVKFGEDEGDQAVTGLTNGGVDAYDLGEISEKPVYRHRLEFYCGLATFGGKAAARIRGVLNS
ncbi:hypothetical protein QE370_000450 [Aeromicrobium sp. SORGH_AS981]|uniref:major capsid protein n=1 Tax=Aeromicrobium sp. SORGH_AS_0981 TaxID=3041802 RepID=UPI002859CE73|nr:hypothetical protein [Aeromicrobium sp. SORGH_AS_0981]MDR6117266.1 hypothetical protein [Aeromicrobium sp. SORGH_AS_0981]